MFFGKAVTDEDIMTTSYATHEPSLKKNDELIVPDGFYVLSGKEQIANADVLQELSLVIDSKTRAKIFKISVFGASTGSLSSTSQLYTYDSNKDVLINNSTNIIIASDALPILHCPTLAL